MMNMPFHAASSPYVAFYDDTPALRAPTKTLYRRLLNADEHEDAEPAARDFLHDQLQKVPGDDFDFPDDVAAIPAWSRMHSDNVGRQYRRYVDERAAGATRRYFPARSHALNFLTAVAPTKLVDGAWLYGLCAHWQDPRLHPLLRIYLEELGDGDPSLNHALLYQRLLAQHGCGNWLSLGDDYFLQGAIQLAFGLLAEEFLPELIGFNLGYEQLPLHLLITAHELRELGFDPFYFTLHITIDNCHTGHAHKALQALYSVLPIEADRNRFMQRVRRGAALNAAGVGSVEIIRDFDVEKALLRVLREKSRVGRHVHSDSCRIGGRTIADWLQDQEQMPQLLQALVQHGWIKRDAPPEQSRFWRLLQGDPSRPGSARMFGVFDTAELQLLSDWITGGAKSGFDAGPANASRKPSALQTWQHADINGDLLRLRKLLANTDDLDATMALLRPWLAPARHTTAAGLHATRMFAKLLG